MNKKQTKVKLKKIKVKLNKGCDYLMIAPCSICIECFKLKIKKYPYVTIEVLEKLGWVITEK